MSCTVSELPSGCRLRGMSSTASQNASAGGGNGGSGNGSSLVSTGGIHVGGLLGSGTTTINSSAAAAGSVVGNTVLSSDALGGSANANSLPSARPASSQKPCCFCWCCCCSCSWAKCLAIKNADDNAPTKRDPASTDLLLDGEQPTLEEIRDWGKNFDKLMKSSTGRKVFRDFLRSEFSEENILFWLACEDLKNESSREGIEEKARIIYEDYISILSPKEVSLDSRVREIVNRNMVEPTPSTFDEAQIQIYTLMHRDSYPRFLNSQKFKALAQLPEGGMSASASTTDGSPT